METFPSSTAGEMWEVWLGYKCTLHNLLERTWRRSFSIIHMVSNGHSFGSLGPSLAASTLWIASCTAGRVGWLQSQLLKETKHGFPICCSHYIRLLFIQFALSPGLPAIGTQFDFFLNTTSCVFFQFISLYITLPLVPYKRKLTGYPRGVPPTITLLVPSLTRQQAKPHIWPAPIE